LLIKDDQGKRQQKVTPFYLSDGGYFLMRKKSNRTDVYYFPDRLKKQLAQIPTHPVTLVEAPSGFGKTTAVREYLKYNLPENAIQYWYISMGESRFQAWRNICKLISYADPQTADKLKTIEIPTIDKLLYITEIIRELKCDEEIYLVIDNYQLVDCDVPLELISILSMHGSSCLHMIFLTQNLEKKQKITFHNSNIHTIESSSFFLDKESIAMIFREKGIPTN
jgi:LuxR family maltose regulon positive regulatory protein